MAISTGTLGSCTEVQEISISQARAEGKDAMAANITPVDVFTTTITVPTDGDAVNGTEVALTTQALANRGENNNSRLNSIPFATGGTVLLDVSSASCKTDFSTGASEMFIGSLGSGWLTTTGQSPTVTYLVISLTEQLPVGATLVSASVMIWGGSVHLPATLPVVTVNRQLVAVGETVPTAAVVLGTQTDTSGNGTDYRETHEVEVSGISHTVLADNAYWMVLETEGGASSTDNDATYYGFKVTFTVP